VTLFNLLFIKTGKFDREPGRFFTNLKDDRETADYELFANVDHALAGNCWGDRPYDLWPNLPFCEYTSCMRQSTRLVFVLLVLGVLALASCGSMVQPPKDPWIGQTKDQLLAQKGTPQNKGTDGHGGEVLVYLDQERRWAHQNGSDVLIDYFVESQFYITADGTIYKHIESKK
jgi:hypothetical protein